MTIRNTLMSGFTALALLGGGLTTTLIAPQAAYAQQSGSKAVVDKAIQDGIIGETASGYLALTSSSADGKIIDAMNEINSGRKDVYTRLAREQNVQIEVVAALTGEKQLAKAEVGTKVLTKEGRWITVK